MGRCCAGSQPARHIVSVRVTDKEMTLLHELANRRGVNISTLLRQSLTEVLAAAQDSQPNDEQDRLLELQPTG